MFLEDLDAASEPSDQEVKPVKTVQQKLTFTKAPTAGPIEKPIPISKERRSKLFSE